VGTERPRAVRKSLKRHVPGRARRLKSGELPAVDCRRAAAQCSHASGNIAVMNIEKITVRITESGKTMDVVVLSKHAHRIEVVLGEGVHNVRCELKPTPNRTAFAGKALGREIVYERSPEQVQADLDRLDPALKRSRPR
jgi:hypothetical protein